MNRVVHFEIHAKDLDKAQQFYGDVFGWKITDPGPQMAGYRMVEAGENTPGEKYPGTNGGIIQRMGEPASSGAPVNAFVCTISIDDTLDVYIDKVKKAGGTMALDKMEIPGVGWLCYCKDGEENIFGMLQAH